MRHNSNGLFVVLIPFLFLSRKAIAKFHLFNRARIQWVQVTHLFLRIKAQTYIYM